MFLFTTTTLINSLKDKTSGKDLLEVVDGSVLKILRHFTFTNDDTHLTCIYKTEPIEADLDYVNVSPVLSGLSGDYRLAMYLTSIGNADPLYANDFVFKGKPLYIEFTAGSSAADTAKAIATNANKYLGMVCDTPMLVFVNNTDLEAAKPYTSGATLVIAATNEYQRIAKIELQKLTLNVGVNQLETYVVDKTATTTLNAEANKHTGTQGFGTYDHLIKDFRLPTAANLRWKRTKEDEMPVAGVNYTEYIFHYTVARGIVAGMGAVGQEVTSKTTHVFWVAESCVTDFESAITGAGLTVEEAPQKGSLSSTSGEVPPITG